MRVSTFFFLIVPIAIYSQGFVKDTDGFVNVRDTYDFKISKVIDTFHNNHLVWINDQLGNWYEVWSIKNKDRSGYIHKSRILDINEKDNFNRKKINENKLLLFTDRIKIFVERKKFERVEIDTKNSYDTDGNLPRFEYKNITIDFQNKKYMLTNEDYLKHLYESNVNDMSVCYNGNDNLLYISSLNSDGAGAYAVVWIINNDTDKIERITTIPF
ncbi:hypothetical protein [Aquimarina brevivitae]|uniref:SH3 domain-containing protein n=1 Tax=Aquimarina brevivitae TaxID=323412 RepID=A0A4Q7NTY0_9FLAO|nr:hypothetical protein [Aquimarina brevivitae]RZS90565.1 hypothetical protein EV197_3359 [Aquimarina brevivitae]